VPTTAHDEQSNAALPTPITTPRRSCNDCPSRSHHEDYRRPCLTQRQPQCPCLDVVRYDRPCPVSSTMPTMSEFPTLKYSQPRLNTSQPSSLQHRCHVSRKRRTDTRSVEVDQRGNTALPPPPATCLRALSGRAGEKACAGYLSGNAVIAEGDKGVGVM
ncbi:hypothetical protein EV363DRAFT_1309071, partial [Boletus edulis]